MERLIEFFCDHCIIYAPVLFMLGLAISRIWWWHTQIIDEEEPKIYIIDKDGNVIEIKEEE